MHASILTKFSDADPFHVLQIAAMAAPVHPTAHLGRRGGSAAPPRVRGRFPTLGRVTRRTWGLSRPAPPRPPSHREGECGSALPSPLHLPGHRLVLACSAPPLVRRGPIPVAGPNPSSGRVDRINRCLARYPGRADRGERHYRRPFRPGHSTVWRAGSRSRRRGPYCRCPRRSLYCRCPR